MPHHGSTRTATASSILSRPSLRLPCSMPVISPRVFSTSCTSEQLGLFFPNCYATEMSLPSSPWGTSPSKLSVSVRLTHQRKVWEAAQPCGTKTQSSWQWKCPGFRGHRQLLLLFSNSQMQSRASGLYFWHQRLMLLLDVFQMQFYFYFFFLEVWCRRSTGF